MPGLAKLDARGVLHYVMGQRDWKKKDFLKYQFSHQFE